MKRLISILLVTVLLIGCMVMATSAASSGTISGAHKETTAGSTVSVAFTISELTFQDFALYLDYDEALTLTSVEAGAASHGGFGSNLGTGKVASYDAEEQTKSGTLFVATFQVPANAAVGTVYSVSVKSVNFINQADETLSVGVNAGSIKIVCGEHAYDDGVVTTAPTCDKDGVKTYTCGKCGDTYTESVPALGHSYDNGVVTTAPTCEDAGVKTYTCANCGDTYTEEIPALGHSYDDGVVTTAPTCEEPGIKTYTCATCGDTYTEEIPATGHSEKYVDGELYYEYNDEEHWNVCADCGTQMNKEDHVHDQERDGHYYCECGHKGPAVEDDDDGGDDEPDVGDITGQLTFSVFAVIALLTTAMVLVFKRKAAK